MAKYKRDKFKRYKQNIGKLIAAYPHLFNRLKPLPLAIGIHKQILENGSSGLSNTMVVDCLTIWCKRIEYVAEARKEGSQRHNLNLTISEEVSQQDRARFARVHDAKRFKGKKLKSCPLKEEDNNQDF